LRGPNGVDGVRDLHERTGQLASRIVQPLPQPSHGERLARRAADEDVRCFDLPGEDARRKARHVSEVRNVGVVVRQDGARKRLNLREPHGEPAKRLPRRGRGLDA
jgi:hypothetical protein